jgi:hypothetical protein
VLAALDIRLATVADRQPLQRMLELYQYDLSDIWDQDLDAAGEFGYGLDRYWSAWMTRSSCPAVSIGWINSSS